MKQEVKQVLDTLAEKHKLTASAVLAAARKSSSPLHDLFDWDDESAANEHRLWQARKLIGEYTIVVTTLRGETANVRAMVNIEHSRGKEGVYLPRAEVLAKPKTRAALIEEVLSQIERHLSLNADLTELAPVAAAVESVRARLGYVDAAE